MHLGRATLRPLVSKSFTSPTPTASEALPEIGAFAEANPVTYNSAQNST